MSISETLLELERESWDALSTDGTTAAAFYEGVLADEVLIVLPGGIALDDRQAVIDSMRGPPWDHFELLDERVIELSDQAAAVIYRAIAHRSDQDYEAWFTSTYTRANSQWKLVLHQQTPV